MYQQQYLVIDVIFLCKHLSVQIAIVDQINEFI